MADLRTTYMGLELAHPVVASASPLTKELDNFKRLEDAGAAAVVMFSLFEEQLRWEWDAMVHLTETTADSFGEALNYFPPVDRYRVGPDSYLELIRRATEAVRIPVIGSLNGVTHEGWINYARQIEQAGAAGLELNIYYIPSGLEESGRDVEQRYLDILKAVKGTVSIPVALKLSPFFSAMGHMARQLDEAGANALVLFNRFYQPDFDLETRQVVPNLELSTSREIRLPLLWIAVLYGKLRAGLAATTGVHSAAEIVKYVMAGADAVMTTSALLTNGIPFIGKLVAELGQWMEEREYASVAQMRGSMSEQRVADPTAFQRANYIRILEGYRPPSAR
ncbi:MAG TPA: dihydroorotate dehydrogenase-like protein [Polyangia bacterium]|nr:dihydroorotate dehydrogenase-like protein [Polyangia bacterium]